MERRGNRGQVLVWGTVGALAVLLATWAINSIHAGNRPALPGPVLAPAKPPKAAVKKREDAGSTTVSGTTLPSFTASSSQEAVQGTTPRVGFNVAFHSGEFIYPFSAGTLKGISAHNDRNMDVNLLFTHRSGITWNGYFGYNWDFYYFKRVVERDVGGGTLELDYYDGRAGKTRLPDGTTRTRSGIRIPSAISASSSEAPTPGTSTNTTATPTRTSTASS